jgi:hypothetical protein
LLGGLQCFFLQEFVVFYKHFFQEKAVEATKQNKEEKRKKPKPEEQEGMLTASALPS